MTLRADTQGKSRLAARRVRGGSRGWWWRWVSRLGEFRRDFALAALDALIVAACLAVMVSLRFGGDVPEAYWIRFQRSLPLVVLLVLSVNSLWGMYNQMWRHASVTEARRILGAGATLLVLMWLLFDLVPWMVPRSISFLTVGLYTALAGAVRFHARLFSMQRRGEDLSALRVVVLGAGERGSTLIRALRAEGRAGLRPVAVLDDDPRAHGRLCAGVPVVGRLDDLATVARIEGARQAILTIDELSPEQTRRLADLAESVPLPLRVLTNVAENLPGQSIVTGIRELRIDDLLSRAPVPIDLEAVRQVFAGRRVLVTGAGGSIGSEIVRQVAECGPAVLVALDHDETHLHDLCGSTERPVLPVLADIRDAAALKRVFAQHDPEIVFHAAAHKHVPVLELHPAEAVRTNVVGTQNVLDAAALVGVERFVFISTDKAVDPGSVMGASKRVAESLVLASGPPGCSYSAVRFGNVLGSRGSVVPTFLAQLAAGRAVTVTDPRMTRFFMTIPEAVQLVMQSAALADGGEIFVLDMGSPVLIMDLAKRMIRLSGLEPGRDVEIRVVGIRPGEKLHEVLHEPGERLECTLHPSIRCIRPNGYAVEALRAAVGRLNRDAMIGADDVVRRGLVRTARALSRGTAIAASVSDGAAGTAPALHPPALRADSPGQVGEPIPAGVDR